MARKTVPIAPEPIACSMRNGPRTLPGSIIVRLFYQPSSGFDGMVGENAVGPGALDRRENLHGDLALVNPTALGGGLDHGEFARHVVGRDRYAKSLFDSANDIEIREGR